jgi:hypothetical protein
MVIRDITVDQLSKIIGLFDKTSSAARRYQNEKPTFDDFRAGFAKITHRGVVKWIPSHKLKKSLRRMLLAQAMVMPLRRRIDYAGIARKIFIVEPLPQGAAPYYLP